MSTYYLPRKTCYFCSTTDSGPRAWITDPTAPGHDPLVVHVSCANRPEEDKGDVLYPIPADEINDTYVRFPRSLSEAVESYTYAERELNTTEAELAKASSTPGYVTPPVSDWESDETAVRVYRAALADAEASLRAYTS